MTTPSPDMLQGLSVDSTSLQALEQGTSMGLARNGAKAETFSRVGKTIAAVTLTSGNANYTAINLTAGTVVTNIVLVTNTTAAGTPTHFVAGLFNSSKVRVATSADLTTTAMAAASEITIPLTAPYTVTADGVFYIGVSSTATTPPTLSGVTGQVALNALAPQPGFSDSTSLTTALPATATVSAGASQFYAYVS